MRKLVLLLALVGVSVHAGPILQIQPVIVQNATTTEAVVNDLLYASTIFQQIGIGIVSRPTLTSSTLPLNMALTVVGVNQFLTDSTWADVPVLTVWYVATIDNNPFIRGVAFELEYVGGFFRTGIGAAASRANDTVAHEIAHVLAGYQAIHQPDPNDDGHSLDPNNLLASGGIRNVPTSLSAINGQGGQLSQITASQAAVMYGSDFLTEVPEPAQAGLVALGLMVFGIAQRRVIQKRRTVAEIRKAA
jgi:hypothetical protein